MKNHRFLWLRNRTTNNRKCEKARNIKEKRTIEMFNTASKPLVELLSSQKDNCIFAIINPKVAYGFGVFFTFGSSRQSLCGATKNSPQDCFLNAATVFKKIIVYLLLSTPKSVMALGIYLYLAVYISA